MTEVTKNLVSSNVATAPSPATSGTSLVLTAGHGTGRGFDMTTPYNAIIAPADAEPTLANSEIVRVTNRSTDTLTITRAQEGTTARTVIVGDRIYAGPTVKTITDLETLISAKQDGDSDLTAIAALTGTNKMIYRDGSGAYTTSDITAAGRAILDDADAAAQRSTLDVYSTGQVTFIAAGRVDGTIVNAKGDLFGATGDDTPARVPAGSNGQVLTANSSATPGVEWSSALTDLLAAHELIAHAEGALTAGSAAGNWAFSVAGAAGATNHTGVLPIFHWLAADHAVSGRTTKLITRIMVGTNGTAPAITFTAGMSAVTGSGGGANAMTTAFSAQTAGTTAAIASPSANTQNTTTSSDFTPPADGRYVMTVTTSGALAATNPKVNIQIFLFKTYV